MNFFDTETADWFGIVYTYTSRYKVAVFASVDKKGNKTFKIKEEEQLRSLLFLMAYWEKIASPLVLNSSAASSGVSSPLNRPWNVGMTTSVRKRSSFAAAAADALLGGKT